MANNWIDQQSELCSSVAALRDKYGQRSESVGFGADSQSILAALNQFHECVRYLNTRRSSGAVLNLSSEAAVQDAVYLMLRPWVRDLKNESPTEKIANRYAIKDFHSKQARTIIEIKFVRDASHGKSISEEIHDDIENYRHHPSCGTIIFFVYDAESLIPDVARLREQIEEERTYSGKSIQCKLIVKP